MTTRIGAHTILPARREPVALTTADGLRLAGELALPETGAPAATLVMLHPLPTHGGSADSHLLRKAAWRLPALAGLAVLRFDTRGTSSSLGASQGRFSGGQAEGADVRAAVDFVIGRGLAQPWLVGWSFGSELALMHGAALPIAGAILLSPPLKRAGAHHLVQWAASRKPLLALAPERDDFLLPAQAAARFALIPTARVVEGADAGHLWVGEKAVTWVLNQIVAQVAPRAAPLPATWDGPYQLYGGREQS